MSALPTDKSLSSPIPVTKTKAANFRPPPLWLLALLTFSGSTGTFASSSLPGGAALSLDPGDVTVSF